MTNLKSLFIFLATALLTGLTTSCDKEENDDLNGLTYKNSEIKEFKMYVGSADGGVEVNTSSMNPEEYFKNIRLNMSDFYEGVKFTFSGNEIIGAQRSFEYKIKDDSVFIFVPEDLIQWQFLATGNTNELKLHDATLRYHYGSQSSFSSNLFYHYSINAFLEEKRLSSIQDLTNPKDTIMWCNINHIFRN